MDKVCVCSGYRCPLADDCRLFDGFRSVEDWGSVRIVDVEYDAKEEYCVNYKSKGYAEEEYC
jgi:hypothetical protein